MKLIKKIENYIDRAGLRGRARKNIAYKWWKFFKAILVLLNPINFNKVANLLSREIFIDNLFADNENVYSQWIQTFHDEGENPLVNLNKKFPLPWMYIKAVHFIEYFLLSRKNPVVLEYGSGTSTIWFSRKAYKVYSIESNIQWGAAVLERLNKEHLKNVELILKPPVKNENDNIPKKYTSFYNEYVNKNFELYVNAPLILNQKFDLILIDGECRVACLDNALRLIKEDGIIVFDNSRRERYQEALKNIPKGYTLVKLEGPTTYSQGYDETSILIKCP